MAEWFRLASRPSVVRRALRYAVVVGLVLITINHGGAILHGEITLSRLVQMVLTTIVPYLVSTASSVAALRDQSAERVIGE